MKRERKILLNVAILVIALCMAGVAWSAPMGTAFTYQGRLSDANSPADGEYDMEFEMYDDPDAGSQQGSTVTKDEVKVTDGYFTVELDFGGAVFTGDSRWLQVAVRPGASSDPCDFATLSPRQKLTPTPYALYAKTAGSASGGGWVDDSAVVRLESSGDFVGIGTTNPAAKLTVNGAILRSGSTMYGPNADTHINLGTSSKTGTDGQDYKFATVGGGEHNRASGYESTVGGGYWNTAGGGNSTVGGGYDNSASGYQSTVGGGKSNIASDDWATVGGGYDNSASGGTDTTVGGGRNNTASDHHATVGGGYYNTASAWYATVPGGGFNTAGGRYSFAAGRRAKVRDAVATGDGDGDEGTFVWADSTDADFTSTGPDQFLIRASGGVGIGTTSPQAQLQVGDTSTGHSVYVAGPTTGQSAVWFYDGSLAGGMQYTFSTDDLLLYTAGTAGLTIDSTGNVGIGTLDPAAKLQVGDTSTGHSVYVAGPTTGQSAVWFYDGSLAGGMQYTFTTDDLLLYTAGTAGLAIDSTGNVGIGTLGPTARLDINGATGYDQLRMRTSYTPTGTGDSNGNAGDIAWDDSYIYVKTSVGWKRTALSAF